MIPVERLNHAVLWVRDSEVASRFYVDAFGFEVVQEIARRAAFLRAAGSSNHHDLGVFTIGPGAARPNAHTIGLYHLAWEVGSVRDLTTARDTLIRMGAYLGESDHGATKSVYGHDPDGNEFEVMWLVPRRDWGDYERLAVVEPLDLPREIERFG